VGSSPDELNLFLFQFNLTSHTMTLGSSQSLTKMSTRNLPRGKGRPALKAGNLTAVCELNVGASTSHKPMALHGLLQGQLYINFFFI
jgi:hypothetical protein